MVQEKKQCFFKSTKSSSPTGTRRTTKMPAKGYLFMYIETIGNIIGQVDFDSFETTDIIQFSSATFHYNNFSYPTRNIVSMGQFRS